MKKRIKPKKKLPAGLLAWMQKRKLAKQSKTSKLKSRISSRKGATVATSTRKKSRKSGTRSRSSVEVSAAKTTPTYTAQVDECKPWQPGQWDIERHKRCVRKLGFSWAKKKDAAAAAAAGLEDY